MDISGNVIDVSGNVIDVSGNAILYPRQEKIVVSDGSLDVAKRGGQEILRGRNNPGTIPGKARIYGGYEGYMQYLKARNSYRR